MVNIPGNTFHSGSQIFVYKIIFLILNTTFFAND